MKHVLSNNIQTGVRKQPFVKKTFEWYDEQMKEMIKSLCEGAGFGILYGCEITYSGGVFSVSAGAYYVSVSAAIPYHEIFLCDAYTLTIGSVPTSIYGYIKERYANTDPILFTDGVSFSVHQEKYIEWTNIPNPNPNINPVAGLFGDNNKNLIFRLNPKPKTYYLADSEIIFKNNLTGTTGQNTNASALKKVHFLYDPKTLVFNLSIELDNIAVPSIVECDEIEINLNNVTGLAGGIFQPKSFGSFHFLNKAYSRYITAPAAYKTSVNTIMHGTLNKYTNILTLKPVNDTYIVNISSGNNTRITGSIDAFILNE